jgi:uncharacterized protein (DUF362 family)
VHEISTYLEELARQAHADGGWGYHPEQPAHLEPTCLGLLALSLDSERYASAIQRARKVLDQSAQPDGTYRLARGRDEAVWPTSLALFVQTVLGYSEKEIARTASALLARRGRVPDDPKSAEMIDIDFNLIGWPWAENNFSWAEPTAWACVALTRAGYGHHPRVQEGLRLLLDRASDEGGVNYGNRKIFGRATEPIPGPTALALMALQSRADEAKVAAAIRYLLRPETPGEDLEHLCWTKLALDVYRDRPEVAEALPALDDRIVRAYQSRREVGWLRPAPLRVALTALALGTERKCFFRQQEITAKTAPAPVAPPLAAKRPWSERFKAAFRGLAVNAVGNLRTAPVSSCVHIAPVNDYNADLADVVQRQYENFRERVPLAGKRVILKPNLVEYHRDKVINTNPNVVAAAIELCKREGAREVIVAEGPGHWRNVEYLVSASGLGDVLRHYSIPFVDLNHDEPVKTPNLGRLTGLDFLYLSRTIATADVVISLPKLKTHHWAGATLSLKNLFGTLPGICYGWPKNELHWRGIDNSIVDIALTRTPDLAIVDAIVGMEGDGPLNGTPKWMGAIVMGNDLLAVDATCCRMMKLDPERIGYLVLGKAKKLGRLGENEIEERGENVADLAKPFETLPHFHGLYLGRSA